MRLLTIVVVLGLVAVVPGAAVEARGSASTAELHAGIQELLDRRAQALEAGDEKAFMATVEGPHRFRAGQRRFFAGITSLPLASYSLNADWRRYGDLARPSDRARYRSSEPPAIPLTVERYRLRGFDRIPAAEEMFYTFVRNHGRWWITSDSDLIDLGFDSARGLWDFGRVEAQTERRLLILRGACTKAVPGKCVQPPGDLAGLESAAVSRVDRYWPGPWSHKVVLIEPASQGEVGRLLQATFGLQNFVAFAYSTVDPARGLRLTGSRVILNPPVIAGRDQASLLVTLSHELVHVATTASAGPFTPAWVDEGIAEYIGYAEDPASLAFLDSRAAAGLFSGEIPPDYEFTTGSGRQIYDAYQRAESAVRYFVLRWGIDRFAAFYDRVGSARVTPGTMMYQVDRALRHTVGMGLAAFRRAWADSMGR